MIDVRSSGRPIIGMSVGLAATGFRPIAEIQFMGFVYPAVNQLLAHAARLRNRTRGVLSVPMVVRMPYGGGIHPPEHHSESYETIFLNTPGFKVVVPSNPYDAKGLLISAIESDDPVVFFEPKRIYNGPFAGAPEKPAVSWASHAKGEVPEGHVIAEMQRGYSIGDRVLRPCMVRVSAGPPPEPEPEEEPAPEELAQEAEEETASTEES